MKQSIYLETDLNNPIGTIEIDNEKAVWNIDLQKELSKGFRQYYLYPEEKDNKTQYWILRELNTSP